MLFEDGNPFNIPRRRINKVGGINTGEWYCNVYNNLCKKDNNVLFPIIYLIDDVTIDMFSHLSIEPVNFTLGIFNRNTRNMSY